MGTFLFEAGQIVTTAGIAGRCEEDINFDRFCLHSFGRHMRGDWGDLDEEDAALNDEAVASGEGRVMSSYIFNDESDKIWIITEADRSSTTILFPYEY